MQIRKNIQKDKIDRDRLTLLQNQEGMDAQKRGKTTSLDVIQTLLNQPPPTIDENLIPDKILVGAD